MKSTRRAGVFEDRGLLWSKNRVPGRRVYDEPLRDSRGTEYRAWNPRRSKLAALARKDSKSWPDVSRDILYLGASTGTTVSHLSDIMVGDNRVFAVEFSPRSVRDLLWNIEARPNVIPILEDAGAPSRYAAYMDRPVGAVVQDVAQRHQVEIFLRNLPFMAPDGLGFLFVKARSIHVAKAPREVYADVEKQLKAAGLTIVEAVDLDPYEKDHRAYVVRT